MNQSIDINDCWNQIGIAGDLSCVELNEHTHCRNCPVYKQAASHLLERAMTEEYFQDRSSLVAQSRDTVIAGQSAALVFRLESEWLAISSEVCQEVAEPRPTHSIPFRRGGMVLGLVNIRGELIISVSLQHVLNIAATETAPSQRTSSNFRRLVVIGGHSGKFAFPASEVFGLVKYNPEELLAVPETLAKANVRFTKGLFHWKDHSVGCLDEELLLYALNKGLS